MSELNSLFIAIIFVVLVDILAGWVILLENRKRPK
jgi:hypothetical protein